MKNLLITALLAAIIRGVPRPAFGEGQQYDPATNAGMPLHGNPNPGQGQANAEENKRDETDLANRTLGVTQGITDSGGDTTDLLTLLSRAEQVKEGDGTPRGDIVALRLQLQRFRQQSDDLARRVDEETNRLEALLLGLDVSGKKEKPNITGQKKNLATK